MALRLYRRHRKECEAGHPEDCKSGEFEEGRRGWKRCGCPIHASGTIRGKFKRQSTGQWEWDAARAVVAQWESAETWCELPLMEVPAPPQPAAAQAASPTIPEATEAFLSKCETKGIRRTTLAKYPAPLSLTLPFLPLCAKATGCGCVPPGRKRVFPPVRRRLTTAQGSSVRPRTPPRAGPD